MDKLTTMTAFARTVELGSFAAAAQALEISPQMLARHVATLERQLGVTLLSRTTRRQSLTDVGRAYYECCRQVLAEVEAADAVVHTMLRAPRGTLRVNAPLTFGAFSLAPVITRYLARYPEVEIDLSLSDRFIDPLEDGFDAVIRIGDLNNQTSLIARPLVPYRLIPCAAPAYIARRGLPATPRDLMQHDCLIYAYGSRSSGCHWIFSRNGHTEEIPVTGRFHCDNWKTLLHATLEGFGITLGPESILLPEIEAGRLVRVLPDYLGPTRPMHILYPARRQPTATLRSFTQAMVEAFGPATAG